MRQSTRLTTRTLLSQMVPILVSLCAFALLPIPQLSLQSFVESTEGECPAEEDGDTAEEELVVDSARRLVKDRRRFTVRDRRCQTQVSGHIRFPRAIIGHTLLNGLCAPLRL